MGKSMSKVRKKMLSGIRLYIYNETEREKALRMLEDGNIDEAIAFLSALGGSIVTRVVNRLGERTLLETDIDRANRLKHPLENDPNFRELLGISTWSEYKKSVPGWLLPDDCIYYTFNRTGFCSGRQPAETDFVSSNSITSAAYPKLIELWRLQDCLVRRLRVSSCELELIHNDSGKGFPKPGRVAHYCKTSAVESILKDGLKIIAISGTNDPTEGKRLASFLECSCEAEEGMLALQCSFSKRIDDLNQFRLYGKDPETNREGTGTCLVFGMDYFVNDLADDKPVNISTTTKDASFFDTESKLPLYWVLYYDMISRCFYHTPMQCHHVLGNVDRWKTALASRANNDAIFRLLNQIKEVFNALAKDDTSRRLAWQLTIYLRHLIKDAAFRDEQEMRILKLYPFGSKDVHLLNGSGPLSADYNQVLSDDESGLERLKEIIVGPKVSDFQRQRDHWKHQINLRPSWGVKITQSQVPLA